MSLFADSRYQWRETYFVLFDRQHRPRAMDVQRALAELSSKVQIMEVQADSAGLFESVTVLSHVDASGMDVTFVSGDEVREQLVELKKDWKGQVLTSEERAKVQRALAANARYDIYHFEEVGDLFPGEEADDEMLDPATLLLVLARLARLCHGVGIDPQAGAVL